MVLKNRKTKETNISLELELYGSGKSEISTKIGFFDHMLEAFSKHSLIDLKCIVDGDIHVDCHHSVEDCGIVLGCAIKDSVYPIKNIERFADSIVVMDEAAVSCAIDICNRPFLFYDGIKSGNIGNFDIEMVPEFFKALVYNAYITAHIHVIRGENSHHIVEAIFKSFAVTLKKALAVNHKNAIPSTKGIL